MDMIQTDAARTRVFEERQGELTHMAGELDLICFQTSIWDESLYNAWSRIVYTLVPNIALLERQLAKFCMVTPCYALPRHF